MPGQLPERVEHVEIEAAQCPQCGLELKLFAGTEVSEVLEIEVQAYRRVIRRRRYRPSCDCGCVPRIVAAPAPARLIERGKFGMSVRASVLLDKLLYGRPSHRLPRSRQRCRLWGWNKPNGELKDMTCRVALFRMQVDGLITLPPSRVAGFTPRSKPHLPPTPAIDPQQPLLQPVHACTNSIP